MLNRRLILVTDLVNHFRWRTRLVLWGAAGLAGLVVAGFAIFTEWVQHHFQALAQAHAGWPWLAAPLCSMAALWLTRRFFPGSQGSGIPQVIAATRLAGHRQPVSHLLSLRIAVGKVLVGGLGLFGGISAGREGPSVQVAASILHAAHRFLPHARTIRAQDLIVAGGAAGIAAAFNTPLAGIVFAIEEMGKRLESRASGVLISTIIFAGLVAIALLGSYTYFGALKVDGVGRAIVWPVVVCSLACGLAGGLFSRLLLWPQRHAHWRVWQWRRAHPVLFAGACGVAVALIGFLTGGTSFGSGYASTASLLAGRDLAWYAPLARFAATAITFFMGVPGGIFAPSLAVGAGLGNDLFSWLFPLQNQHAIIALCMAGFLAAVTQSPLTAAIIVMEMIDGHEMVVSLMAVSLLARVISARLSPPLYHQLSLDFAPGAERPAPAPRAPVPPVDAPASQSGR